MAVMIDPQRLLSIGSPDERNIEIVERMMREDRPKMHPIKREFQTSGSPEGYLVYKEPPAAGAGRSIYDIKLDVPINFVAPEVLVGPARDGFAAHGFAQDDALEEMIGQFLQGCIRSGLTTTSKSAARRTPSSPGRRWSSSRRPGWKATIFFRHPSVQPGGARFDSDASQGAERNQSGISASISSSRGIVSRARKSACTRARARCSPWPIRITTFPARTRR